MLKLCNHATFGVGTIAGGPVMEPCDVRLAALWRHDSVKATLPREVRADLIREASRFVIGRGD